VSIPTDAHGEAFTARFNGHKSALHLAASLDLGKAGFYFLDRFINCFDRPSISYQIPEGPIAREFAPQLLALVHFTCVMGDTAIPAEYP
jgi:hypothetical protein